MSQAVNGEYWASPPTLSDRQKQVLRLDAAGRLMVSPNSAAGYNGGNPTYRATGAGYLAYATPTDLLTITGSDTKTVIVTALNIAPGATANTTISLYWIKRSAANTGGTSATQAITSFDSADSAATAVVRLYSAAPSGLGTSVGNIAIVQGVAFATTGAPSAYGYAGNTANGAPMSTTMLTELRKPIVLRGSSEMLALNFNGAALPTGFTASWAVEWVEV